MTVFLTVLEGSTPSDAKPILATRDRTILRLVADELSRRLAPSNDDSDTLTSTLGKDLGAGCPSERSEADL